MLVVWLVRVQWWRKTRERKREKTEFQKVQEDSIKPPSEGHLTVSWEGKV